LSDAGNSDELLEPTLKMVKQWGAEFDEAARMPNQSQSGRSDSGEVPSAISARPEPPGGWGRWTLGI
jgi:hypothetical protein